MKPLLIAPSILSADFGRLAEEVKAIEAAGADWVHVDVMDGRFVPNITLGPVVIEAVRKATSLPLNVHLMMVEPELMFEDFIKAGADHLVIQAESTSTIHLHRQLSRVRDLGKGVGVALNPATSLTVLDYVLPLCDTVLIMTVNPGFGGQQFLPEILPKIEALKAMATARGLDPHIEIDGGINAQTIRAARAAGADAMVAGSAIFGRKDYGEAIAALRAAAEDRAAA